MTLIETIAKAITESWDTIAVSVGGLGAWLTERKKRKSEIKVTEATAYGEIIQTFTDTVRAFREDNRLVRESHKQALDELKEYYEQREDKMRVEFDQKVVEIREEYEARVEVLRDEYENKISALIQQIQAVQKQVEHT